MGYTHLLHRDARCWLPGDIVVLPAERYTRKHVRIQPSGASRLHISVGETTRSENSVNLFQTVFTESPEVPKTLVVIDVTSEEDQSYEEDNLFVPGGRPVTMHAALAPVDLAAISSPDRFVWRGEAMKLGRAMRSCYAAHGHAAIVKRVADAAGFSVKCTPEDAFRRPDAQSLRSFIAELYRNAKSSRFLTCDDSGAYRLLAMCFPQSVDLGVESESYEKNPFFNAFFNTWQQNNGSSVRSSLFRIHQEAVEELVQRGVHIFRPDDDSLARLFGRALSFSVADGIAAFACAAEVFGQVSKAIENLAAATKASIAEATAYHDRLAALSVDDSSVNDSTLMRALAAQREARAAEAAIREQEPPF